MRNRDNHLGKKVFEILQNGQASVDELASQLNELPRSVAVACVFLHRTGKAMPVHTGNTIRSRFGKLKPEVFWQLGCAEKRPPMPYRGKDDKGKRHDVMTVRIGVDQEHLDWMEKYKKQGMERAKRRHLSADDVRLRL